MFFKDDKRKETFVHDTKILFDGLRNLGLCMVFILVGHFGFAGDSRCEFTARLIGYAVGGTLFVLNVAWVFVSSKEKGIGWLTIGGLIFILAYQGYGLYKLKSFVFEVASKSSYEEKKEGWG